ncbi:MAG: DUF202 domain-containing protein [Salinisphaera sp.]|nr:DUF202 domain-containing protein [Salinisphaera sp.]
MPEKDESEQIALMRKMVELAEQRTRLAEQRTEMSAQRSRMSAERSAMSTHRSRLSTDRSGMSAERSEYSADRSFLSAERTLSVWVRTALSLMVFGIAIDRFGLLLGHDGPAQGLHAGAWSAWGGIALVAMGVVMVVSSGLRFMAYVRVYRRYHEMPWPHGPFLAPVFALLVALFGLALIALLVVFSLR